MPEERQTAGWDDSAHVWSQAWNRQQASNHVETAGGIQQCGPELEESAKTGEQWRIASRANIITPSSHMRQEGRVCSRKKKSMRGSPRPKPPTERRNREAHVTAAMRRSVYRKHGAVSEEWASGKLGGSGCNKQFKKQTDRLQRSAGRSMPRCSCDALRVARTTRHSKSSVGSPRHNTGSGQIKHRVSKSRCQGESPAAVAGSLKGPKDLRRELNAKSFDKATRAGDMEKAD